MTTTSIEYKQHKLGLLIVLVIVLIASLAHADAQTSAPPLGGDALLEWLERGHYMSWHAESTAHGSAGPHFGSVRAFLNSTLYDSLNKQKKQHPKGSVAVKELYGNGDTVRGWAVAIKTASSSNGGSNWYWYEYYDDSTVRDGTGVALCSACHSSGRDYVLTPWPLM